MPKPPILDANQSYTFRSYFELPHEPEEILAEFGYGLARSRLSLPQATNPLEQLPQLRQRIERVLPLVSLTSEAARREVLVAPVLMEVATFCNCPLKIEYPLNIDRRLQGNLDYWLRSRNSLLVVEAKNDDLTRGFIQLAVELIALAMVEDRGGLYGAVTTGQVWQFAYLERDRPLIAQDLTLYRVPDDLEDLTKILIGILQKH